MRFRGASNKCNDLFSAANPIDMGKALDIFSSDEMQRWMFSNMAPHINITDQGI